jgi:Protein of unknown function (DUF4231)
MQPEGEDSVLARLEDQIGWYDAKAISAQHWYKRLKVVQLLLAASIPVAAAADASRVALAVLGALVVVVEGLQQLNHFHENWIQYRSTCEALRRERQLFIAVAGPYTHAQNPIALLAERTEGLMGQEGDAWVKLLKESARGDPDRAAARPAEREAS